MHRCASTYCTYVHRHIAHMCIEILHICASTYCTYVHRHIAHMSINSIGICIYLHCLFCLDLFAQVCIYAPIWWTELARLSHTGWCNTMNCNCVQIFICIVGQIASQNITTTQTRQLNDLYTLFWLYGIWNSYFLIICDDFFLLIIRVMQSGEPLRAFEWNDLWHVFINTPLWWVNICTCSQCTQ